MAHGGKRPGAGRKPGSGNRQVLSWNGELLADPATLKTMSPLRFLLEVMRDPAASKKARMEAAKAAAPYVHGRPRSPDPDDQVGLPLGDDGWGDDLGQRPN